VTPLSVNLSGLFERGPFSAKVTYSYDKARTVQLDGFVEGLSVKSKDYNDLSFSTSFDITPNFEVFAEGSNLLDETIRNFNTYDNVPAFYEQNGRSFFLGIRARL
jgi:iron complex outermembrane recepter protein